MILNSHGTVESGIIKVWLFGRRLSTFFAFVSLLFLIPVYNSYAATYYVDFAGGNDSNDGTSTSTPLKHCPGDPAASSKANRTLAAGDSVIFRQGVSYHLDNNPGPIRANHGGASIVTGSNGAITAAGVFTDSAADFSNVTTAYYVYIYHSKASFTGTWAESVGLYSIKSVDSAHQLTFNETPAAAHSTAEMTYTIFNPITYKSISSWGDGSGYGIIDGQNTRVVLFNAAGYKYIRLESLKFANAAQIATPPVSTDPANSWVGAVSSCIIPEPTGTSDGSGRSGDSTGGPDYFQVINCYFDTCLWRGIDGQYWNYSIFSGNYFNTVHHTASGVGLYNLTEKSQIIGPNIARGIGEVAGYSVIRYNTITNATYNMGDAIHSDDIGPLDCGQNQTNMWGHIYGNLIDDGFFHVGMYSDGAGHGPNNYMIYNNVFIGRYTQNGGTIGVASLNLAAGHGFKIYNNIFYGWLGAGWGAAIWGYQDCSGSADCYGNAIDVKNNIFYTTDNGSGNPPLQIDLVYSGNTTNFTSDYNHFYSPNYPNPTRWVGVEKSLSAWKALGYDIHGFHAAYNNLTTDPQWASLGTNFSLQSTSPDRAKGTNLSSYFTLDRAGRARSAWDIGAYEYVSSTLPQMQKPCLQSSMLTITASAGTNGVISPSGSVPACPGDYQTFTITPQSGYTASVSGTCGGSLVGSTYTTNPITAACTVSATFTQ